MSLDTSASVVNNVLILTPTVTEKAHPRPLHTYPLPHPYHLLLPLKYLQFAYITWLSLEEARRVSLVLSCFIDLIC